MYTHLNAELQRIARRGKKASLSEQGKEVEKNNRTGKTWDFLKIRNTKGTRQAKMGTIRDGNGMDLREAEGTKKRWQEYTEELHQKKRVFSMTCRQCMLHKTQTARHENTCRAK